MKKSASKPRDPKGGNSLLASGRSPEKYQRILEGAIAVFAETGFHQARVSEIAARAGVADGTIYLYFDNKEQMLMAAIESAFARFLERARRELEGTPDPKQRLHRLAFLHLETLGADRNLAIVVQTQLRQSAAFLAQFSRGPLVEYFNLVRETVRQGQRAGLFRPELSDKIAANCFFGALDEMVTSWVLSERRYDLAAAADVIVDVILRGMENRPGQS